MCNCGSIFLERSTIQMSPNNFYNDDVFRRETEKEIIVTDVRHNFA